jgi:cellulose synthase/poly-beta-1,6-N-acetylglucosamine synthase-like glycosyltransferase
MEQCPQGQRTDNQVKMISIIIPVNNSPLLSQVCRALAKQIADPASIEVLLVGLDDVQQAPDRAPFHFIPTPAHWNAAQKRNLAITQAKGELLFFLDSDCLPEPEWLAAHIACHEQGKAVVGGSVALPEGSYLQLGDNVSAFHDLLPYLPSGPKRYLATANLSLQRSVVTEVGLMQPALARAHDLAWTVRMRQAGYILHFEPQAVVVHDPPRHSATAVLQHWTQDAHDTLWVRLHYTQELATPSLAGKRWLYLLAAPFIAAWATGYTFEHQETRHRYGHTLPLVYLTKLAWCWGAFRHFPKATFDPNNLNL